MNVVYWFEAAVMFQHFYDNQIAFSAHDFKKRHRRNYELIPCLIS